MQVDGVLSRIGDRTGTDKATFHGFTQVYERFFHQRRNDPLKLLEVGILRGESLKMWEEYFPNAAIYGLDITLQEVRTTFSQRTRVALADQTSPEQVCSALNDFGLSHGTLDIAIDDGGHRMSQQNATIGICWPFLKSGGTFIIEDVHTAFPELIGVHQHMPFDVGHLDETPTSATRIQKTMLGAPEQFPGVPVDEIRYVSFISNVATKSFTCLIEKR